jgi:hypothetical protein
MQGAELRPPSWVFTVLMKLVAPAYLVVVFALWCYYKAPEYVKMVSRGGAPLLWVAAMAVVFVFFCILVHVASQRWEAAGQRGLAVGIGANREEPR